jgi:hypothetical protein
MTPQVRLLCLRGMTMAASSSRNSHRSGVCQAPECAVRRAKLDCQCATGHSSSIAVGMSISNTKRAHRGCRSFSRRPSRTARTSVRYTAGVHVLFWNQDATKVIGVWIDGQQRDGIDEGWISRTIQGLRHDGQSVCVRVTVKGDGIDLALTAGSCPPGQGGRQPTARERALIEAWSKCAVSSDANFPPGRLIQCLKELQRAV